jgi:hypothetical protein
MHHPPKQTVTVYTWPFEWLYWPMYRALYDVEQRYAVEFKLQTVSDKPSDEKIRLAARTEWNRRAAEWFKSGGKADSPEFILALCEPDLDDDDARDIPLVWRMPHFLMRDATLPEDTPRKSVLSFPSDTTSGKYAREQFGPSGVDADGGFDPYKFAAKPDGRWAFHFAPLYQMKDKQGKSKVKRGQEYVGPTQVVSVLSFPPRRGWESAANRAVLHRGLWPTTLTFGDGSGRTIPLFQAVLNALSRVIRELEQTHGLRGKVQLVVTKSRNRLCLPDGLPIPPVLAGEQDDLHPLASFIASYTRRGCYFPYQAFERAVRPFVEMAVQSRVELLTRDHPQQVRQELTRLLGNADSWAGLSFAERRHAMYRWGDNEKPTVRSKDPLWMHFPHSEVPAADESATDYLQRLRIDLPNRGEYTLLELYDRVRPVNHWTVRGDFWPRRCGIDPTANGQESCFVCYISGFLSALASEGRSFLRNALSSPAGRSVEVSSEFLVHTEDHSGSKVDSGQDHGTLSCWDDLKPFFEVFARESRVQEDAQEPLKCCIQLVSGGPLVDPVGTGGQLLVSILWKGPTTPRTNSGRGARKELPEWSFAEKEAGRSPAGVWLWWAAGASRPGTVRVLQPDDQPLWLNVWSPSTNDERMDDVRDRLWNHALNRSGAGTFSFAYVALYDFTGVTGGMGKLDYAAG